MNTAVYAERTARATDRMIEACQRIATVKGFEDVAELVANATHKDKDAKVLFQREVFAVVMERVADQLSPDTKPKADVAPLSPDDGKDAQIADDGTDDEADAADDEDDASDDETKPKSPRAAHKAAAKPKHR